MRTLLLLALAACGDVHSETPIDAAPRPDAPVAPPPDARSGDPGPCPMHIADPALPVWFGNNGFTLADDPAGSGRKVWRSSGPLLATTSFVVPYQDGDRLVGLTIEAYGTGSSGGLQTIQVVYRPAPGVYQILGQASDEGRGAQWGTITFPGFQPATLSAAGLVEVSFAITELGYYLGRVTPSIERPCPMH